MNTIFKGRKLLIVTQHKKESVLKAPFEKHLGVECFVSDGLDTDVFGSFSGETERLHDPITTLRQKCLAGMQMFNCDLAVASEGSFGPHPTLFAPADDELLCFIDQKNTIEILVRELTLETNFDGQEVTTEAQLEEFALRVKFPSHGLIVKKSKSDSGFIIKGISTWTDLRDAYRKCRERFGAAYVETDMRASYNPGRMKVISRLGERLARRMATFCPKCNWPGFGVTEAKPGLPCEQCGMATGNILAHVQRCAKCQFEIEEYYPNKIFTENPAHCDYCNP